MKAEEQRRSRLLEIYHESFGGETEAVFLSLRMYDNRHTGTDSQNEIENKRRIERPNS